MRSVRQRIVLTARVACRFDQPLGSASSRTLRNSPARVYGFMMTGSPGPVLFERIGRAGHVDHRKVRLNVSRQAHEFDTRHHRHRVIDQCEGHRAGREDIAGFRTVGRFLDHVAGLAQQDRGDLAHVGVVVHHQDDAPATAQVVGDVVRAP